MADVVQLGIVAIGHGLQKQLDDLLHIHKAPFVSIGGPAHRRGIYGSAWMPNGWRVFYQPVNRPQWIDGGILQGAFDKIMDRP